MYQDQRSIIGLCLVLLSLLLQISSISCCITNQIPTSSKIASRTMMNRRSFTEQMLHVGQIALLLGGLVSSPFHASAFTSSPNRVLGRSSTLSSLSVETVSSTTDIDMSGIKTKTSTVLYQPKDIKIPEFGVTIPIASWYPLSTVADGNDEMLSTTEVTYQHRISVRRIGQLLAGWNFIPEFVSKNYSLIPTSSANSNSIHLIQEQTKSTKIVTKAPVIFLAHGYLGSRFDLSHLAEELSSMGYICIAAEYPESLAASYERFEGLDRSVINAALLNSIQSDTEQWNNVQPTAYGIIGHSLGCGTAVQMGNDDWARVLLAGFPQNRDGTPIVGNNLFITSINDSLVRNRINPTLISSCNYQLLNEQEIVDQQQLKSIPKRTAIFFDRPDAPNHISYLCEGVNNAMIEFLSPLLPLAQALSIPVLDFDKYKVSQDSVATASIVHPMIIRYLQQELVQNI